ncbi:MAG: DUF2804 domain-containing protein [Clostridia bacterium]|nr:DUF2804 domain-containing protein [Clostridia bacterium]
MEHQCTPGGRLLDAEGRLREPGWATALPYEYSPFDVRANRLRIKEWDYYIAIDDRGYSFATVIADNRYMGLLTGTLLDLNAKEKLDYIKPLAFPMGRFGMPTDSRKGDLYQRTKTCRLSYVHVPGGRRLIGKFDECRQHGALEFDLLFTDHPTDDTMVIVTPWAEDKRAFYYNQKINCMEVTGSVCADGRVYEFGGGHSFGTMDWGRGVWTYDNTWYWGSGNGLVNGKRFGYNIGCGFGDTTAASENMIFYDGKAHKLGRLRFDTPADLMQPWHIVSADGRFDMEFRPIFDNRTDVNALILAQDGHQVFGYMNGVAVLDDGTRLEIRDLLAFNERVRNRY